MPNFLILGAAKSGTTAIYLYIRQHPEIFMPQIKEPLFFALEGEQVHYQGPGDHKVNKVAVTDIETYKALFSPAKPQHKALGEGSTNYLYSPKAAERIKHYVPNAKLIAILRNPADRAFSTFLRMRMVGREPLSDFGAAIAAEEERIRKNWQHIWHYKNLGFYYEQVKRYFDLFPREQLKIYLFEDLRADSHKVVKEIFEYLGVDTAFEPQMFFEPHLSGEPKSKALFWMIQRTRNLRNRIRPFLPIKMREHFTQKIKNANIVRPPYPAEVRRQLIAEFRNDILKLQDLLERDLSMWLKEKTQKQAEAEEAEVENVT